MMPDYSTYTTTQMEKSFCPDCESPVLLLAKESVQPPAFFICYGCQYIGEVGVGRVMPEGGDPEVRDPDGGRPTPIMAEEELQAQWAELQTTKGKTV